MSVFKKIIYGKYRENRDKDLLNRILIFNIGLAIFIITAIPFAVFHIAESNYIYASVLFTGVVIVIAGRVILEVSEEYLIAFIIMAVTAFVLLLFGFITGGINNHGPLWYFCYPMAVLVLLGLRNGTIASLCLILASILLLFPPLSGVMMTSYEPGYLLRYFIAYLIIFIFAFGYEFNKRRIKKEITELKGLIPICASCKRIRDERGYWEQIESYIQKHSEAEFSHSICSECTKKLYPDLDIEDEAS